MAIQTVLIFVVILLSVTILSVIGVPVAIHYRIDRLMDSFEKTDFNDEGRVSRDYLPWNERKHYIKIDYHLSYRWSKNPFNRKNKVSVTLQQPRKCPDGFIIALTKDFYDSHLYSSGYEMPLKGESRFYLKIDQIDNFIDLSQPKPVNFDIHIVIPGTGIRETIHYDFFIGQDLGDSWVAIDSGTTATTIAFGNENREITIAKNKDNELLTPSVLVYEMHADGKSYFGQDAVNRIKETRKYLGFRSIKKLLGYKDTYLGKTGKELAATLLYNIFHDIKLHNPAMQNAKRVVVTIPNNYTAVKIQDMLFCAEKLTQFKEIRTIYEAEAIIFYYLSNKSSLENQFDCKHTQDEETVLVFDMGGATINTTVASLSRNGKDTCEVNILSKIGYGIGGDSIDYCILKSLFEYESDHDYLKSINIFNPQIRKNMSTEDYNRQKEVLFNIAFLIKLEIARNFGKNELVSAKVLETLLSSVCGKDIYIDIDSRFYSIFKSKSKHCLLNNEYFTQLIYNNIDEATGEVLRIAGKPEISKIILSGRSSSFPCVLHYIFNSFPNEIDVIDLNKNDKAKTAVSIGACWYGLNNNSIKLNNRKTSANFGFVKTQSADTKDIHFENLVETGMPFDKGESGAIKYTQNSTYFKDKFSYDGRIVKFYQVIGSDMNKILIDNEKHKYNKIASIRLLHESEKIAIRVNENDNVNCSVRLVTGKVEKENGVVADQEIADANDKHYYWIIN